MPTRYILNFPLRNQSIRQKSTVAGFPVISRKIEPGQQNPRIWHQHDCLEIAVVLSGTAVHILGDQSSPIREGDVLLIGPNLIHGYEECATLGLYNILYNSTKLPVPILDGEDIPVFQRFLPAKFENPQYGYSPTPIAHFPDRDALDQAVWQLNRIHQELTTASLGNMFAGFARFLDFLVTILRLVESPEPSVVPTRQWIFPLEEILAFLNKNYTRRIALTTLVKMSHLSERNFQCKFKKLTGHTVSGYLLRKRLAKAKAMLECNTSDSIPDIAFDCGFEDPNYFIRQFRRAYGFPPGKYRRQVAKLKP